MKVLQNLQKFRVLWHGRTKLTEVPGSGMNVLHNLQKFRLRVIPGLMHTPSGGGGSFIEVEDFIQLAWHVLTGPMSPRQSVVASREL